MYCVHSGELSLGDEEGSGDLRDIILSVGVWIFGYSVQMLHCANKTLYHKWVFLYVLESLDSAKNVPPSSSAPRGSGEFRLLRDVVDVLLCIFVFLHDSLQFLLGAEKLR